MIQLSRKYTRIYTWIGALTSVILYIIIGSMFGINFNSTLLFIGIMMLSLLMIAGFFSKKATLEVEAINKEMIEKGNPMPALEYYQFAAHRRSIRPLLRIYALENISTAYILLDNLEEGEKTLQQTETLALKLKQNKNLHLMWIYNQKTSLALYKNDTQEAEEAYQKLKKLYEDNPQFQGNFKDIESFEISIALRHGTTEGYETIIKERLASDESSNSLYIHNFYLAKLYLLENRLEEASLAIQTAKPHALHPIRKRQIRDFETSLSEHEKTDHVL